MTETKSPGQVAHETFWERSAHWTTLGRNDLELWARVEKAAVAASEPYARGYADGIEANPHERGCVWCGGEIVGPFEYATDEDSVFQGGGLCSEGCAIRFGCWERKRALISKDPDHD